MLAMPPKLPREVLLEDLLRVEPLATRVKLTQSAIHKC